MGVVHAGEWVAPQELVNSPATRPIIDALERARRNNVTASITPADVSRSMAAPAMLAAQAPRVVVVPREPRDGGGAPVLGSLDETLRKLQQRLEEPFVTVNTVTGDSGIRRAQEEYERLMANKSRRGR